MNKIIEEINDFSPRKSEIFTEKIKIFIEKIMKKIIKKIVKELPKSLPAGF